MHNNFRVIKKSDNEARWQDVGSGEILAVMEELDGTINFKRLWKQ